MKITRLALLFALVFANNAFSAIIQINTIQDVDTPADGLCSLREAISAANTNFPSGVVPGECAGGSAAPTKDRIRFQVTGAINPSPVFGDLPKLTDGYAMIDGWSAPGGGPGNRPRIMIDCAQLGGLSFGIDIESNYNQIRGLSIVNCTTGIRIYEPLQNVHHNWLYGNVVGLTPFGVVAANGIGIGIAGSFNLVGTNGDGKRDRAERNIVSGNSGSGISVGGAQHTRIAGNFVGVDASGSVTFFPRQSKGIQVQPSALYTIIGTNSDAKGDNREGNLVSGNGTGIESGGFGTVVAGNLVGTDVNGMFGISNIDGVFVTESGNDTRIGTDGDGTSDLNERNVISGNNIGVKVHGTYSEVSGNFIGLGADGMTIISNGAGVSIERGPQQTGGVDNLVGGPNRLFANYISRNNTAGINQDGDRNTIECNFIGVDTAGGSAPNSGGAVEMQGDDNIIRGNNIHNHFGVAVRLHTTGNNIVTDQNDITGNGVGLESSIPVATKIEDNWWGDASGPYHATANPTGLGDEVIEVAGATLDFAPWLIAPSTHCNPVFVAPGQVVELPVQAVGPQNHPTKNK